jgi:O-antigen/teichoic acid export membrane protein
MLRVGGVLLAYASHLAFSRLLGLHDYGIYVILIGWAGLLSVPARLGFDTSALRYATVYLEKGDWPALRGYISLSLGLVCAFSGALAVAMVVVARIAGVSASLSELAWASTVIVSTAVLGILSALVLAAKRVFASQFYDQILRPALMLMFIFSLYFRSASSIDPRAALIATSLAGIAAAVVLSVQFGAVFRDSLRGPPDFASCSAWVRVSLPLLMIAGIQELMNQLQVIMLGWLADAASAGLYAAAWRLASLIGFGLAALGTIGGPMVASAFHRGDLEEVNRIAGLTARLALGFAIPAAAVLFWWGRALLTLFGPEFAGAYPVLLVLVAGALVNSATGIVAYLLTLTGREIHALTILLGALLLNVLLNLALISTYHAFGAAVASAIALGTWNLAMLVTVRHSLGVDASALARSYHPCASGSC